MTKSDSIKELATALAKAQGEFGNVKKDANNPFFKSKYADLASNVEEARPTLAKHGLAVSQLPSFDIDKHALILTTILMHNSGEWMSQDLTMPVMDLKAQSVGSALTYARRYALQAVLGLAAEDDDGAAASGTQASHEPTQTRAAAPRTEQPKPPAPASTGTISEPQQKRFFAIANKSGATADQIKALLTKAGYGGSKEIRRSDYEMICGWFESGEWADKLSDSTLVTAEDVA